MQSVVHPRGLRAALVCVQGFVCLMQLSTRDEDFVIDALTLRSQIGGQSLSVISPAPNRSCSSGAFGLSSVRLPGTRQQRHSKKHGRTSTSLRIVVRFLECIAHTLEQSLLLPSS